MLIVNSCVERVKFKFTLFPVLLEMFDKYFLSAYKYAANLSILHAQFERYHQYILSDLVLAQHKAWF